MIGEFKIELRQTENHNKYKNRNEKIEIRPIKKKTSWYESGNIKSEDIYKDRKIISKKEFICLQNCFISS